MWYEIKTVTLQKIKTMRKDIFILGMAAVMTALMTSCAGKADKNASADESGIVEYHENAPGDSTLYGLACDGCNDSIVMILPYAGGNPDTFNIVRAMKRNKIYGEPRIGCRMALTVNPLRHDEAQQVIVLDDIEQQWSFKLMPEIIGEQPDSVVERLMVPREYSYHFKSNNQMRTMGNTYHTGTSDEQEPAIYPEIKQYNKWSIYNGKLILAYDVQNIITADNDTLLPSVSEVSDTAEIVYMATDSLVLRIKDRLKEFYRSGLK